MQVININVEGATSTGKTSVVASIKQMLEKSNYAVAIPSPELRQEANIPMDVTAYHDRPQPDKTVFCLTETANRKRVWLKKCINYLNKWDEEDYGYVKMQLDGALIRTNNLDCDGGRYFNKKTFRAYINKIGGIV